MLLLLFSKDAFIYVTDFFLNLTIQTFFLRIQNCEIKIAITFFFLFFIP